MRKQFTRVNSITRDFTLSQGNQKKGRSREKGNHLPLVYDINFTTIKRKTDLQELWSVYGDLRLSQWISSSHEIILKKNETGSLIVLT